MAAETDAQRTGSEAEEDGVDETADEALIFNLLHKSDADRMVKRSEREQVLQNAARSLIFEYGFDLAELERNFSVRLSIVSQATGRTAVRRARVDIAAFDRGTPHRQDTIVRAGLIAVPGTRPDDDKRGIAALDFMLGDLPRCEFGFWTNGTELAFRRKVMQGHAPEFQDIGDMPAAGETLQSLANQRGRRRLVAASPDTLAQAFRRCHNYIYGNQGINRSLAFWEFLRLIFCKMYDEQREAEGRERMFWVGLTERFTPQGKRAIRERLERLFEQLKGDGSVHSDYAAYFRRDEKIELNDAVLAYVAGELSRYDMLSSSEDAKGAAYEEVIDRKQKGDRGQFFTPRNVIKSMVELLDPDESDYILDPACGTGGFLVAAFRHVRSKIEQRHRANWADQQQPTNAELVAMRQEARAWAAEHIWGFDFDQDLAKAAQMNLVINGGAGRVHCLDSLKYPEGETDDAGQLIHERERAYQTGDTPIGDFGTFTLCLTNPPFGSKIPITDRRVLQAFDLARQQRASGPFAYNGSGVSLKRSVPPEILFIERCMQWLAPGGRLGIVLPDGILGNPKDVYIRRWILDNADVLASVDMPVETFLPQVGVQPSLLFLQKKTPVESDAEAMGVRPDRPVFMAIVDRVGKDRRGNLIYKRNPDGTDAPPKVRIERHVAYRDGQAVTVEIPIEEPVEDDELPDVLAAWGRFRVGEGA